MRLTARAWVVLGAALGILIVAATDRVVPATSAYQAQMRIWLAARTTGITTYLLLTGLVTFGLVLSHPTNQSTWKLSTRIFPWHENLFVFVVAFVVAHVVSIVLDTGTAGALLEAGGDLVARGAAPQAGPWLVGIERPRSDDEVAVISVRAGAVCTSAIAVHAWTTADGRAVHHLVDPRTGEPGGDGLLSVTVAGPDPAWAEVWSKTLFLEGADGIGPRARALGLAAWWIRDDGRLEMTPAARPRTAWLAGEA